MIADAVDTFRNATQAVNLEFVRKIQIAQVFSEGLPLETSMRQSYLFFRLHPFAAQCSRNKQQDSNNAKLNNTLPNFATFDCLH